jgi:hypothetical protein
LWPSDLVADADAIAAIHNAIQSLPEDLDLSDPAFLTPLPFPSPLEVPFQRFEYHGKDPRYFQYMGRSKFTELYDWTQRDSFLSGFESIYLYGSSGSGKSHILAALACRFIREGKRVVYIPDCRLLLDNFSKYLRLALRCAFYDSPHLKTVDSIRDFERLLEFCENHTEIYFIVDQLNALELGGRNEGRDDEKKRVKGYLARITSRHKYIFSAPANQKSNQAADSKQTGISVIRMHGGMNQVSRALTLPRIMLTVF